MASVVQVQGQPNPMLTIGQIADELSSSHANNVRDKLMEQQRKGMAQQQQFAGQMQPGQLAALSNKNQAASQSMQQQQQLFPYQLQEAQSQTKKDQFFGDNPALSMPSTGGQYALANYYMTKFPPGSPQYKTGENVLSSLKSQQNYQAQHGNYYDVQAKLAAFRYLPAAQKEQLVKQLNNLGYNNSDVTGILQKNGVGGLYDITTNNTPRSEWIGDQTGKTPSIESQEKNEAIAKQQGSETSSMLFKKSTPTTQQNAVPRANTALKNIKLVKSLIPSMKNVMGLYGAGNLASQRSSVALGGSGDDSYAAYRKYLQLAPMIINETRAAFTGPQTDAETKMLDSLAPKNFMTLTPKLANDLYDNLTSMLEDQKQITGRNLQQNIDYDPMRDSNERDARQKTNKPVVSKDSSKQQDSSSDMVNAISPDGKPITIPRSMVSQLLAENGKLAND